MLPYLIPIVLTGVSLVADYLIRQEMADKEKKPRLGETPDSTNIEVPNNAPLSFGEWVDKMPKQTKVIAVATVAGSLAMMHKTRGK